MKHSLKIISYLMLLFITTQILGLYLLNQSIEDVLETDTGGIDVVYTEPITGRPELEGQQSFNYIVVMIILGTALLLLLIRFKLFKVWKIWFFLAVWGALSISLSVFLDDATAIVLSLVFAYMKLYRRNAVVHNLTEVLIYPGIAIIIAPMLDVFWASMMLLAISVYDMIAVWKSKHMVKMAEAQSENKMFAGLIIPYTDKKKPKVELKINKDISQRKGKSATAILGGGDVAFPMIFAGAVMTFLIENGTAQNMAFFKVLPISLFSAIALLLLFLKSRKGKFYPAMPFISAGCFIGYGITLLM